MLVANNSFPGPELRVHKGDTAFVNVHNQGDYGVTIHWHGVRQPRNPWSDGPENITQCPIPPKTNFTQEIIFTAEEGTLWWHAHSDWTRATVHGALIIYPKKGTVYPFPKPYKEQTIVLASWYKSSVMEVLADSQASGQAPNVSDAFTINGQPGDKYSCSNETTFKMKVQYGKTYLLRIVNAILNENTFFAVANHSLTIVGQDASYTKHNKSDYLMITPGQCMDVLFTANHSRGGRFYIAARAFSDSDVGIDRTVTTAIIEYYHHHNSSSSPTFPKALPNISDADASTNFKAKLFSLNSAQHPITVPKNINRRIYMTVSINILNCSTCTNNVRTAASVNNITFYTPNIDILQAYYNNIPFVYNVNGTFPEEPPYYFNFTGDVSNISTVSDQGTKALMLNYLDEVEIVFQGTNLIAAESHPIHLHGYSFFVVGTGFGNYNKTTDPLSYNLYDPPEVNTMVLPKNGWTAIRFIADNPGVWFMHCHLERHTTWGMSTVFINRNGNTTATSIRSPPSYMPPLLSKGIFADSLEVGVGHVKQSIALIVSKAAAILPAFWALRQKAFFEWVLFTASGVSSGIYHACDVGTWCPLPYGVLQFMDFWLSFMAVVSVFIYLASTDEGFKRTIKTVVTILTAFMALTKATRGDLTKAEDLMRSTYLEPMNERHQHKAIQEMFFRKLESSIVWQREPTSAERRKIRKANIVNLIGSYAEGDQRLLVYEYMPLEIWKAICLKFITLTYYRSSIVHESLMVAARRILLQ
ncbi:hypothetical protein ACFE04_004365 [Oxalis oulophora]